MEFALTTRANSSTSQYVASSQPSSPRAISHGFLLRPHCRRFHLGPSQRSVSHGFPSVHPGLLTSVDASISLLPKLFPALPFRPPYRRFHLTSAQRALPKLFPRVSHLSTVSTRPPRSFPMVSPPSTMSSLLPNEPLPKLYFHGCPSVHTVVASALLPVPPNGALPKLFPTVSRPSTLLTSATLPSRSFPIDPNGALQAISNGFPSVHPVDASISPLLNGALPELFPTVSHPSILSSLPFRSPHGKVN